MKTFSATNVGDDIWFVDNLNNGIIHGIITEIIKYGISYIELRMRMDDGTHDDVFIPHSRFNNTVWYNYGVDKSAINNMFVERIRYTNEFLRRP